MQSHTHTHTPLLRSRRHPWAAQLSGSRQVAARAEQGLWVMLALCLMCPCAHSTTTFLVGNCVDLNNAFNSVNVIVGSTSVIQINAGVTINIRDCKTANAAFTALPTIQNPVIIQGPTTGATPTINGNGLYGIIMANTPSQNLPFNVTVTRLKLVSGQPTTGNNQGGCINLMGNVSAVISSVTFQGCSASIGGAVYAYLGSLTITQCTFLQNMAGTSNGDAQGGAIYVGGSGSPSRLLNVVSTQFTSNFANTSTSNPTARGGAVYSNIPASFSNCDFTGNGAYSITNQALGGAFYSSQQTLTLFSVTAKNNFVYAPAYQAYGGAFFMSQITAQSVTFDNNLASGSSKAWGGAVYFDSQLSGTQTTFTSCVFTNNDAVAGSNGDGYAGAVGCNRNTGTRLEFYTCTFTANTVTGQNAYGGAVVSYIRSFFLSCPFSSNTAVATGGGGSSSVGNAQGGAIYSLIYDNSQTFTFSSCTFTSNSVSGAYSGAGGACWLSSNILDTSSQFINNKATIFSVNGQQAYTAYGGAISLNSYGAVLQSTGSTYQGNSVTSGPGDAAGGALSLQGSFFGSATSFLANTATSSCGQQCVTSVNNVPSAGGGAIYTSVGISSQGCTFSGNKHISTTGLANGGAVAAYVQSYNSYYFYINGSTFLNNAAISNSANTRGGAVAVKMNVGGQTNTFVASRFTNNYASGDSGAGGAIFLYAGPVSITSCSFVANYAAGAGTDGALGGAGAFHWSSSTIYVYSSTFTSNYATASSSGGARGGAIYTGQTTQGSTQLQLSSCSFTNNSAVALQLSNGGALWIGFGNYQLSSTISACSFDGNYVQGSSIAGGALFYYPGTINAFCRPSFFGRFSPNLKQFSPASQQNSDIDANLAVVKFCPSVSVNVDNSLSFTPIIACDLCTCTKNLSPCDPKGFCALQPIPGTGSQIVSCTCPYGVRGNGFTCGNILMCNS